MHRNIITILIASVIVSLTVVLVRAADSGGQGKSAVISVREFELRSGVKPQEFEDYARQEHAHALSQAKTGTRFRILKGDRGDRKGGYLLIWEFESVAARNEFFPKEGGGASPACQQAWKRIKLAMEKFSIYVQDYGAPIGYRIASRHQDAVDGIVVQNGNAYVEGIGEAFNPMKPFWADRNAKTEKPVRALLTKETTVFQYTHGVKDPQRISPDAYTVDQFFLDRPANDAIQLELLYDYQSNVALYDGWHEYFRTKQPRMLIVWGTNDPFFTVEGAKAYQRDIPRAELYLIDTGHFALEDSSEFIAERIRKFFG